MSEYQFLIIGSGIAGLNFALQAAQKGKVLIITKKKAVESSTNKAQGGIAAVLDKTDNFQQHIKDTLDAGCHHNSLKAVQYMVKHGPEAIKRLIEYGVNFASHDGQITLTREGGHKKHRIAFVGDYTGQEIEKKLLHNVRKHPSITLLEHTFALKLLVKNQECFGVQIINAKHKIENVFSDHTIIATGGIGQLYKHTTNPRISTGDGFAIAEEAGCDFKDMEFIQFHPTAFDHNNNPKFLLSEALRGEGARLVNQEGKTFMDKYDKQKELAPRDIVSRAIFEEQKNSTIFLDITHESEEKLEIRFPQIYKTLLKHGYNIAKTPIPITPVAHYACGGIKVDFNGRTKVKRLFAFGEVAYTGVHGANRLASNSLLEALVFSNNILQSSHQGISKIPKFELAQSSKDTATAKRLKARIKNLMWQQVGITREKQGLEDALHQLKDIKKELSKIKGTNQELAEARNMCTTGILISEAALANKKSIGCHYRIS